MDVVGCALARTKLCYVVVDPDSDNNVKDAVLFGRLRFGFGYPSARTVCRLPTPLFSPDRGTPSSKSDIEALGELPLNLPHPAPNHMV